jgi:hypothetical protein
MKSKIVTFNDTNILLRRIQFLILIDMKNKNDKHILQNVIYDIKRIKLNENSNGN